MTTLGNHTFNNMGRIGADKVDNSQKTIANTKQINYSLENHFRSNSSDEHIKFATQHHAMSFKNTYGGIPGDFVDRDSLLSIKSNQQREFEKLQLHQRPFATVPYLGRGGANPDLESKLIQGEVVADKKSTSTIMDKSYIDYEKYPLMDEVKKQVTNPSRSIEELALDGWVRGGVPTREQNMS
jgi:hypothetical protein